MRELAELGPFAASVLDGGGEPFVAWLGDGCLLTINPAFARLTGYRRDELEGMRWPDDFAGPETCDRIKEAMGEASSGKEMPGDDVVLRGKDGSRADVTVTVRRHCPDDGGGPLYYSFVASAPRRRRERMALREAEAQAELLLDLMSNDIRRMNQVSVGYLELALGTARLSPGERELIMTALGSLMNAARVIDNVERVQGRDRPSSS